MSTTTTTSKRQLKRLSLLQTAPSPTSAANGLPDASYDTSTEPCNQGRSRDAASDSPSSYAMNSPAGSGASSNSRRQSTINYVSRAREEQQHSSSSSSTSPLNHNQQPSTSTSSPRTASQIAEEDSPSATAAGCERTALTLVEKHADLLQFIAQKESKCLELRSQLAVHEAELLELKRKWERIVSRGFSGGPPPGSTAIGNRLHNAFDASDASPQTAAMLNGIREGMQGVGRFIAGLGVEATMNSTPNKGSEKEDDVAVLPTPILQRKSKQNRADRESNSSVSTSSTDASSRLSQSSMSSIEDVSPDDNVDRADGEETKLKRSPVLPEEVVYPTRIQKRSSNSMRRRKDLSISHASFTLLPTQTHIANDETPVSSKEDAPESQQRPSHKRTATMSSAALPPPSSIPGLSTLATGNINPLPLPTFSSWVDTMGKSVGKKFEQMQGGRVHKRASTLLSEASSSLFAVLAPPSPSPSPSSPSCPDSTSARKTGSKSRKSISTPPTSAKSTISQNLNGSLIDDAFEDELETTGNGVMAALVPDKIPSSPASPNNIGPKVDDKDFDNDEWNW